MAYKSLEKYLNSSALCVVADCCIVPCRDILTRTRDIMINVDLIRQEDDLSHDGYFISIHGLFLFLKGDEKMIKKLWEKCVDFHGHECPGLAIGYKASQAAKEKLKIDFSKDEDVVCITENDACGVDAIQVLLGCSFGKGNLIYRGTGKQAFSFFHRPTNQSIRIVLKPFQVEMGREERQAYLLNAPVEEIFEFKSPGFQLPERARLFKTIICENCGEGTPEHKIRLMEDKKVCLDCFKDYSREL
ncbi:FmdE family protein [Geosporobacter ferrireducens]|uniref:FmdE family protein n=1 Tax=Geosporobacter ferrireducens TaxID=1424294 RepID=UPI002ED41989